MAAAYATHPSLLVVLFHRRWTRSSTGFSEAACSTPLPSALLPGPGRAASIPRRARSAVCFRARALVLATSQPFRAETLTSTTKPITTTTTTTTTTLTATETAAAPENEEVLLKPRVLISLRPLGQRAAATARASAETAARAGRAEKGSREDTQVILEGGRGGFWRDLEALLFGLEAVNTRPNAQGPRVGVFAPVRDGIVREPCRNPRRFVEPVWVRFISGGRS